MKSAPRPSFHPPDLLRAAAPRPAEEEEEPKFFDRPCYEFNRQLSLSWIDKHCEHCRHYLTARCPHIDEFLDDVEDLSPE